MSKIEQAINSLQNAQKDLERIVRAKNIENNKSQLIVEKAAAERSLEKAAKELLDAYKASRNATVKLKFDHLKHISNKRKELQSKVFQHTNTGGVYAQREIATYAQIAETHLRDGMRFYEIFPGERVNDLKQLRILRPTSPSGTAAIVPEGAPKPSRVWQLNATNITPQKMAVTDLVTEEFIRMKPDQELLQFLITAHTEHLLDRFDLQIQDNIYTSPATLFNPAAFTNSLLLPPGTSPRWHDLLAAAALYFKEQFSDNIAGVDYPDTILVPTQPTNYYWGVIQDRETDYRYLHKEHDVEQWYRNFEASTIWPARSTNVQRFVLFSRDAFRLDLYDEIIISFERIAETASETNQYRLTVELFYYFYPFYLPARSMLVTPADVNNIS